MSQTPDIPLDHKPQQTLFGYPMVQVPQTGPTPKIAFAPFTKEAARQALGKRGLCPECNGGTVRDIWDDEPGMRVECINCGAVFNLFERMREMDRMSAEGDQ